MYLCLPPPIRASLLVEVPHVLFLYIFAVILYISPFLLVFVSMICLSVGQLASYWMVVDISNHL